MNISFFRMKVLAVSTVCLLFATCVLGLCPSTGDWSHIEGKCMKCGIGGKVDFLTAQGQCEKSGGNLASIVNQKQEDFAETCSGDLTTTAASGVWFGLKLRSDGNFSWADGTTYTSLAFITNNVTAVDAGCYYINSTDQWAAAVNCSTTTKYNYVCTHALDCGVPQDISNGDVSFTSTLEGGVAVYKCNYGYLSSIDTTRQCQSNGTWSGSIPSCAAVKCADLTDPASGDVSHPATNLGSTATYSCDSGYKLSDDTLKTRTCLASGSWSASAPTCEKRDNTLAIALGATAGGLALVGAIVGVAAYLARRPPTPMSPPGPRGAPYRGPYPRLPGPPNRGGFANRGGYPNRGGRGPYPFRPRGGLRGYPRRPY